MAKIGVFDLEENELVGGVMPDGSVNAIGRLSTFMDEVEEDGVPVRSGFTKDGVNVETIEFVPLESIEPDVFVDSLERAGFALVQVAV